MPHFVDEDQSGKSEAEPRTVEAPVDAEKRGEADEEFQLEDRAEQDFAFGQDDCNRSNRAEFACPLIFGLGKLSGVRFSLEFCGMALDPIRLLGKAG